MSALNHENAARNKLELEGSAENKQDLTREQCNFRQGSALAPAVNSGVF
jgi:hypothetical protein